MSTPPVATRTTHTWRRDRSRQPPAGAGRPGSLIPERRPDQAVEADERPLGAIELKGHRGCHGDREGGTEGHWIALRFFDAASALVAGLAALTTVGVFSYARVKPAQ